MLITDFVGGTDVSSGVFADGEGNWYVDIGATTHVAHDFGNLAVSTDYNGNDNILVGNGNVVPISSIGFNSMLNNILFVPQIIKNLLSISQFTKDNNVVIEFNSDSCFVKDKLNHKILLRGNLTNGLYKLDLTQFLSKQSKPSSFSA